MYSEHFFPPFLFECMFRIIFKNIDYKTEIYALPNEGAASPDSISNVKIRSKKKNIYYKAQYA